MHVSLRDKAAFQKILKHYQPDEESIQLLSQTPLVILLGVSASGRNTIINHLVNTGGYKFIVSDTTRPPKVRDGKLEQTGVQYHFRTEEEVLTDLEHGKFLEAELIHDQQVSGTSIRELTDAANSGKIPINEVDMGGTDNILKSKPDTDFFFIVPPNYDTWMQRLKGREQMSETELKNRLNTATKVLQKGLEEDHFTFVINERSIDSAHKIDQQVRGQRDIGHHAEAKAVAEQLLQDIQARHGL